MLTNQASNMLFLTGTKQPTHLAYVEWFTLFQQPELHHGLYKVSHLIRHGERLCHIPYIHASHPKFRMSDLI